MHHTERTPLQTLTLSLGALGVVYGDIGTSPLYAFRDCFNTQHNGVPVSPTSVYGLLALIAWSLFLIVAVKYLIFVLRADNKGEGGILALLALAFPERKGETPGRWVPLTIALGVAGSCLLYGDGIITPAISVLGAVEGLGVATHTLEPYIMPIAIALIIGLFAVQKAGTEKVGKFFGPVTLVWFVCIAALGVAQIVKYPQILGALSPTHAVTFLLENPWPGFKVLGSVVLVVTGGEALYADMGHFGRQPIRIAWFAVVLPCLLLNYLGQGAYLLQSGAQHTKDLNLFYALCPEWALYPMVGLATAAAIIASQALISGAYSLTMQAIQLGYVPRLSIAHTSEHERGQIYMPQVNWILMIGCLLLVVGFGSSERLAGVYGVAVTFTMLTTTLLLYYAARRQWEWPVWKAILLCGFLFAIELPFGFANLLKIPHGGWFTLVLAAALYAVMATWKKGRKILWDRVRSMSMSHADFGDYAQRCEYTPVKGIAVFMSGNADGTPLALTHNLKHNRVLHREIIFITVLPAESPRTKPQERVTFEEIPHELPQPDVRFYRVKARIGFMEQPDVPALLALAAQAGLPYDPKQVTFFLSRETIIPSDHPGMALWREWVFSVLSRNAQPATAFFKLPTDQVVELGMQVEI